MRSAKDAVQISNEETKPTNETKKVFVFFFRKTQDNNTLMKRVLSFVDSLESLLFPTHSLKSVGRNKSQTREMEYEEHSAYAELLGKMMKATPEGIHRIQ